MQVVGQDQMGSVTTKASKKNKQLIPFFSGEKKTSDAV
jgi:hypothetical protein